ncbi:hypothetical protein [Petrocella sp. FN5]|jgi:hypothetical protein|uniref:hypothetical protein n=1 Tax=Petrocella sp. FN5 TaxID=3032002 RepID=UPI000CC5C439|nr:hypothetical protein [Petrocella sp. FN5]MDF1617917.1 hypothetical protein [Petrocella sp. FN5]PKM57441.1 MAG: hypothetical protein CVU98_06005 [Firmicutes bacterium HGW-Firmicutes-3]
MREKNKLIEKRGKAILPLSFIMLIVFSMSVSAYSLDWGWVYNDPLTVSVYINSNVPNLSDVVSGYDNWDSLPEVDTYRSYNFNYTEAYIIYSSVSNDSYADTTKLGSSDWKQITIRPPFSTLTSTKRKETIAHEMGHCWGLNDIYDSSLLSGTIMRGTGFNNNPYPKQDDKNGIAALY